MLSSYHTEYIKQSSQLLQTGSQTKLLIMPVILGVVFVDKLNITYDTLIFMQITPNTEFCTFHQIFLHVLHPASNVSDASNQSLELVQFKFNGF